MSYLAPLLACAVILALESRAPRRAYWPIVLVGVIGMVTTGYVTAGAAPGFAAALPPLAAAINVRSTERYMERDRGRAIVLSARWLVAVVCYATIVLGVKEILAVLMG